MIHTRILDLPVHCATHSHSQHQLIVGLDGCADFEVMGQGGAVSRLHACLVPGHEAHAFSGRGTNHMLILDLAVDTAANIEETPNDDLSRLFEKPRFVRLDQGLQGLLDFAAHQLAVPGGSQGSDKQASRGRLVTHPARSSFSRPPAIQTTHSLDLSRIDNFIRDRLDQPVSVAEMAAQVHISPSHFHALFKQRAGQSPHQYLLSARIGEAVRLICNSAMPLSEVASRCGFSSQSALTHAVRQRCGETPRRLRMDAR